MCQSSFLILTSSPFPSGLASTNRIIGYCKGFLKNNANVKVIVLFPTERSNNIINHIVEGEYQGIKFQYASKSTVKKSLKVSYLLQLLVALFRTIFIINEEKKKSKINVVIYYSKELSLTYFFYIIIKFYRLIFLKEESESPEVYFINAKRFKKLYAKFYLRSYRLFNGCLVMTRHIWDYLKKLNIDERKLLHVPQTVEYERFLNQKDSTTQLLRITYCGLLNQEKDGIIDLIYAFSVVSQSQKNIELFLIGDAVSKDERNKIEALIVELNIKEKTIITGLKSRDEIPDLLNSSSILVMPRPRSHQAENGFPTKLVEYLSTGKPVIATNVGEIGYYLKDNESIFFVEPNDINALSSKIQHILRNSDAAKIVGLKGRDVVISNFSYVNQTASIIEFVHKIMNNKRSEK